MKSLSVRPDVQQASGIYFTLNKIDPALFHRSANRTKEYAKQTTSDANVIRLNWLPVDLDPIRPSGISSSDEEHDAAISKAKEIKHWLVGDRGWPEDAFVVGDSGNGAHLPIKIDLETTKENVDLVKKCLNALDFLFSDDVVEVDTGTGNPARIWKLPGTMARKGDSSKERPHRMARLLEAPNQYEDLESVPSELLEDLAAILPKEEPTSYRYGQRSDDDFDPVAYAEEHGLKVSKAKPWNGGTLVELEECPFNPDHKKTARIVQLKNGALNFGCFHDGCKGNDWQALRDLLEPDRYKKTPTATKMPTHINGRAVTPDGLLEGTDRVAVRPDGTPEKYDVRRKPAISEGELENIKIPEGPKFENHLPPDHLLTRYIGYGSEVSDAYSDFWYAGGLHMLSVLTDKKLKVDLRQGTLWTNLNIMMLGKSSLSRKSTVVARTEELLQRVRPSLMESAVPTEFSPEAFIEHLSENSHAHWIRDEAAGVLSAMRREYMRGFKDSLMQLYDCRPFYRKLRTSYRKGAKTEFRVDDPYLNVLWATTDASFSANTEQNDTLSGFLARFLFHFPQRAKEHWLPLEEGSALSTPLEDVAINQLTTLARKIEDMETTAMHLSPDATTYYVDWQRMREAEWLASNDGHGQQIYSRLAPTVAKLAILFEFGSQDFDPERPIRLEFIQEACRQVDEYYLPTAKAVYDAVGADAEKNVIDRIISFLKNQGGKATQRRISRHIKIKAKELNEYLATMEADGTVSLRRYKRQTGRSTECVILSHGEGSVGSVPSVNQSLLSPSAEMMEVVRCCSDSGDISDKTPEELGHVKTPASSMDISEDDKGQKTEPDPSPPAEESDDGLKSRDEIVEESLSIVEGLKGQRLAITFENVKHYLEGKVGKEASPAAVERVMEVLTTKGWSTDKDGVMRPPANRADDGEFEGKPDTEGEETDPLRTTCHPRR